VVAATTAVGGDRPMGREKRKKVTGSLARVVLGRLEGH
jgi:hypothetical protein